MLENNQISEHKIQNDIRVALSENGCTVFRTNTGKVKMADGRWFDTGLPRGFSDLCGFRHSDGKMFFIEVKNQIGKRRQDQVKFANFVSQYPVLYGVARSVEDALEIVAL
ncbi:VRR-NUC domain-containing protein [Lactobacillus acetotolerans]|uniref:VRR-NUC domain-containing protein n=1 Tax=Lactobacillus acetotolerans TaxID=1600 RepID=UPI002FDA3A57